MASENTNQNNLDGQHPTCGRMLRIVIITQDKVGVATFLNSLPYPHVKVPAPYETPEQAPRYYALPTGDMLEVTMLHIGLIECDGYLIMWRKSVPDSERYSRSMYKRLFQKRMLLENTEGTSSVKDPSDPSLAFSFRDSKECARVLMEFVERIRRG